jgi:HK97 family phage major capsid protein
VESGLATDLEKAVAAALDEALLNPNNAGIANEVPASITHGAPTIASSGSTFDALRADLSALISAYQGELESAALIMSARTAVQISLLAGASAAVDLSASGGTLFGLPVATTSALAGDSSGTSSIAIVDTQAVAYALDNLAIETSSETSLLMSDSPSGGGQMVSLFQTNTTAWKSEALANWEVQRSGGVVLLTGVNYA